MIAAVIVARSRQSFSGGGSPNEQESTSDCRCCGLVHRPLGAAFGLAAVAGSSDDGDLARNAAGSEDQLAAGDGYERGEDQDNGGAAIHSPGQCLHAGHHALQAKGKNTGAAVVVFPGGGYQILAIDLEGTEVCDWLNSAGVTCVLLKYRVPDTGPYPKSPAALQDAQRAMGLVRLHASEWGIDPEPHRRAWLLGRRPPGRGHQHPFRSAPLRTVDAADKLSCRPDFAVVVYPGYLALADKGMAPNVDINPTASTPPTFIVQAEDDPVHVENATNYFMALKNAKVPAELHIYAEGGHGYGLRRTAFPVTDWPQLVEKWLHTIKILPAE